MKKACLIVILAATACSAQDKKVHYETTIQQQVLSITEVMYHDVINPPAAARFYAYSILCGYEILSKLDHSAASFRGKLNQYPLIDVPFDPGMINVQLAAMYGILETGRNIIPSGYLLEEKEKLLREVFEKKKIPASTLDSSISFAQKISRVIVQYAKTDGYFELSTLTRYTPVDKEGNWRPTAPEYMPAVEPHWRTIRPFFLDSSGQFITVRPTEFNSDKSSAFMQLATEVYETGKNLSAEQKLIADFWDCNPFAVQFEGHMSIGLKKISPGGHWIGITGEACNKARLNFTNTLLLHTLIALTLHDAFICCWDEKYRSNRIRPETTINRYIDEKWKPFLQTPPFPEYVSGHSVISTAAAELLTYFLGDGFSFTDSTEMYIGLPARQFSSFRSAAAEARISRLYGGIHFRDAIENGGDQGRNLGKFVVDKIGLKPVVNASDRQKLE